MMKTLVTIAGMMLIGGLWADNAAAREQDRQVASKLNAFREYELNTFSSRRWEEFDRTFTADVAVHWPDGRYTKGLKSLIEELKALCVHAPDTRISSQLVAFGSGDWTTAVSKMEGTFSQPMPVRTGAPIPPTNRKFGINISSVAHWNAKARIDELYLFWDNASYAQQLGFGQGLSVSGQHAQEDPSRVRDGVAGNRTRANGRFEAPDPPSCRRLADAPAGMS